ncbi:helix-turn-helix transcriptional regulator [Paenibacillus polymyxa]|uniref:helix-turn-helix domain-containing protein n=1 Tax=Paenibacillus polymyxa TaxID=1406 RepID=UPI002ED16889|nr:helix-turn-helix transcriptional regulator [Paenibacillus polymyxa]
MTISVKAARVNAGLKQQDAADHLNLSLTGYQRKEDGTSRFYVDEAVKLSKLFGTEINIFFNAKCHKKTRGVC